MRIHFTRFALTVVFGLALGVQTSDANAAIPSANCTAASFEGHEYAFCRSDKHWDAARLSCESAGMKLVTIDSSAENTFVRSRLSASAWIGANDRATEDLWIWSGTGQAFWNDDLPGFGSGPVGGRYNNWATLEPNDLLIQDCGRIDLLTGVWFDDSCSETKDFVCELTVDLCPADPNKTDPGQCGCGVPDTDSDGDQRPNCLDRCPSDPNHTEPGDCGCVGESNLRPAGAVCFDGPCGAANQCDGAGKCGSDSQCKPESDCQLKEFDGHAYLFCKTERTWEIAREKCRRVPGMDLVHIGSAAEDAFVAQNIYHLAWIGGNDRSVEGAWSWVDDNAAFWSGGASGTAVGGSYTNWQSGEPDNLSFYSHDGQDCALHTGKEKHGSHGCGFKDGGWASDKCGEKRGYVCEEIDTCAAKSCQDLGAECGSVMDGCGRITNCGSCASDEICSSHQCGKPGNQVPNKLTCAFPDAFGGSDEFPRCDFPMTEQDFTNDNFYCPVDPAHVDERTLLNTNQQLTTTFSGSGAATVATAVVASPTAQPNPGCAFNECTNTDSLSEEMPVLGTIASKVTSINTQPPPGSTCAPVAQPDFCPVDPASLILPAGTTDAALIADTCDPENDTCPGNTECTLVCKELACKDESEYAYHCGLRYQTCNFTEIPNDGALCSELRECTDPAFTGVAMAPVPPGPPFIPNTGDANFCCSDSRFAHPRCGLPGGQAARVCATDPYIYGDDITPVTQAQRCTLEVAGGIDTALESGLADQENNEDDKWGMTYMPVLINNLFLNGRPFGQDFLSIDEGAEWVVEAKVFGMRIEIMNLSAKGKISPCEVSGTTTARVFGQDIDVFASDTEPTEDFPNETPSATVDRCKDLYQIADGVARIPTGAELLNGELGPVDIPDVELDNTTAAVDGIVKAGNLLKKSFFNAREITKALRSATSNQWSGQSITQELCQEAMGEFYNKDTAFTDAVNAARGMILPEDYCTTGTFNPQVATEVANSWIRDYEARANDYLRKLTEQMQLLAQIQAEEVIQIEGPEDQQFLDQSAQFRFPIGPLNVLIEIEASGSWGVDGQLSYGISTGPAPAAPPASGPVPDPRATADTECTPGDTACNSGQPHFNAAFSIVPHVTATGRAFLGLEIGNDLLGADVGIQGSLKLISIKTPMNARVSFQRHAEPDPRPVGLDFRAEDFLPNPLGDASFHFKPVLYSWDLTYGADSQLIVETMSGQVDVRARLKFALFSKTFKKKLADWTGYVETFDLIGTPAPGETGKDRKLLEVPGLPDLGAFEMELRFPKIPPLPPIPASITNYALEFPNDPEKEARFAPCIPRGPD